MPTNLKYNIESRLLTGSLENVKIRARAGSGGRAGSKTAKENILLANNSLATHIGGASSKGTHNFGPIPRGVYSLRIHESRKNWIRLIPKNTNNMFGRSGFAIHGRGTTGSHGCIVPEKIQTIITIVEILKSNPNKKYTLEVESVGSNIGWQNRIG